MMDLSVQKMQPPASVSGKSAAKRKESTHGSQVVEDVVQDQDVLFHHGNTGYEHPDTEDTDTPSQDTEQRKQRRKNRQLLSREDLSELTVSVEAIQQDHQSADELMQVRAYQSKKSDDKDDTLPHFEVNI